MRPKCAVDANGLIHEFQMARDEYGVREARTDCGHQFWEEQSGVFDNFKIVPRRMVTCMACLGAPAFVR